jgi:hypothetical protein
VKSDQAMTMRVSVMRAPKRSPSHPPGSSKNAYANQNAPSTTPISALPMPRSALMSSWARMMHTLSK